MRSLILAFSLAAGGALAADSGPAVEAAPRDTALASAREAISNKDWSRARSVLREALARDPKNAEYHNLYAYANRKAASPDLSLVFKHYNEALSLDPKHRGAHEYIGEAYLMVNNVGKAREHLARLDKLCFFSCREFTDLKNAITEYETKKMAK